MATVFTIENTAGTLSITLQPGQLNGPGSTQRDTDMRLYGLGAQLWGEGVDTNILRLTENFACPEKAGSPGVPQDENDLGAGNGITTPINGQLWFNTTTGVLYVYDAVGSPAGWETISSAFVSATAPTSPSFGDLWFDLGEDQLKIYTSGSPAWKSVADRYVLKSGDTMTGPLVLSESPTGLSPSLQAATKAYADSIAPVGHAEDYELHLTSLQNDLLDAIQQCAALEYGSPSVASSIADDICNILRNDGDSATTLSLTAPTYGGAYAGEVATKSYADGLVGLGSATRLVRYFSSQAAAGKQDGDINVSGSTVYVYAGGAWRQIFPAVYT